MRGERRAAGGVFQIRSGRRILRDGRYCPTIAAAVPLSFNLLYALYHGALGIAEGSLWFLSMCGYYVILGSARFSAILYKRKNDPGGPQDGGYLLTKVSGALLLLLSLVLAVVNYMSLSQNIATKYHEITMITIATYTFSKIVVVAYQGIKGRGYFSPLPFVLQRIRSAEAAASVLTLQRSMIASFGEMERSNLLNGLTGGAVCLFISILGAAMITRGIQKG